MECHGTRVVFYNKDLLAKAGLDPEKPPVTWQQLLDACKAIHNPKEGVFGFGMNAGEGHILYKKYEGVVTWRMKKAPDRGQRNIRGSF